jgi:hypothetical protein
VSEIAVFTCLFDEYCSVSVTKTVPFRGELYCQNLRSWSSSVGHVVAQWLRRKDAGSIPDGVTGIFH